MNVAVMSVVPAEAVFAMPSLLIVATLGTEELHTTWLVRSMTVLSLNVPFAVKATDEPTVTVGALGVTTICVIVALLTFNVAVPVLPANTAVIAVDPGPMPVAVP